MIFPYLRRLSPVLILLTGVGGLAAGQAGSPVQSYLRYRQTLSAPDTSTTVDSLRGNRPERSVGGVTWRVLPTTASFWYNTTYPFGWNDGAVWRGRGATASLEGGISGRWKSLSATIDPQVFVAENRSFAVMAPVSPFVANAFADPMTPFIDRPQRFGDKVYGRVDGGQSTVRMDALGVSLGASTASQWIGPMSEWPFLLSNNAPGIPRFFAGSSSPWNIGIGRIHGQVFYGGLSQSAFVNEPDSSRGRIISGITGSFFPRFLPGLEIGAGRLFEYRWPQGGFGARDLRKPFEAFLKEHVKADSGLAINQSADNQLASLFARWVLPRGGLEVYGEFGRDDHNWNARDATLEPDHISTYGLGLRKAWLASNGALRGFRFELLNLDPSTLARARPQGSIYEHTYTKQGHTQMGQVLGAGFAATAGGGTIVAVDRFTPSGDRTSYSLTRLVIRERPTSPSIDVQYAIAGERTRRVARMRITYGLTAVYNMSRYFVADVGNVMTTLVVSW